MDKQNAKEVVATVAATAIGNAGGTLGAKTLINNDNDVPDKADVDPIEPVIGPEPNMYGGPIDPIVDPYVIDPEPVINPEPDIDPEPVINPEPDIDPEPVINPEPDIDPEPDVMYGGPYDPTVDPIVIDPEPDMYGGPIDYLNQSEDEILIGNDMLGGTSIDDGVSDDDLNDLGDVD